eukprot:scaffold16546_cov19-Prasinocladus_malaysianus.AAC.1
MSLITSYDVLSKVLISYVMSDMRGLQAPISASNIHCTMLGVTSSLSGLTRWPASPHTRVLISEAHDDPKGSGRLFGRPSHPPTRRH